MSKSLSLVSHQFSHWRTGIILQFPRSLLGPSLVSFTDGRVNEVLLYPLFLSRPKGCELILMSVFTQMYLIPLFLLEYFYHKGTVFFSEENTKVHRSQSLYKSQNLSDSKIEVPILQCQHLQFLFNSLKVFLQLDTTFTQIVTHLKKKIVK